jgi:hypothetical protein
MKLFAVPQHPEGRRAHDAGIISRCFNLTQTELPLDGNAVDVVFKVYMRDSHLFLMFHYEA